MYLNRAGQTVHYSDSTSGAFSIPALNSFMRGMFGFNSYRYQYNSILQFYKPNSDVQYESVQVSTAEVFDRNFTIRYAYDKANQNDVFFICPGSTGSFYNVQYIIKPVGTSTPSVYDLEVISDMVIVLTGEATALNFMLRESDIGQMNGQLFTITSDGLSITTSQPDDSGDIITLTNLVAIKNLAVDSLHTDLKLRMSQLESDSKSKFISR